MSNESGLAGGELNEVSYSYALVYARPNGGHELGARCKSKTCAKLSPSIFEGRLVAGLATIKFAPRSAWGLPPLGKTQGAAIVRLGPDNTLSLGEVHPAVAGAHGSAERNPEFVVGVAVIEFEAEPVSGMTYRLRAAEVAA